MKSQLRGRRHRGLCRGLPASCLALHAPLLGWGLVHVLAGSLSAGAAAAAARAQQAQRDVQRAAPLERRLDVDGERQVQRAVARSLCARLVGPANTKRSAGGMRSSATLSSCLPPAKPLCKPSYKRDRVTNA